MIFSFPEKIDVIRCGWYFKRFIFNAEKNEINQICAPQIAFQIPHKLDEKLQKKFLSPPSNENQITKLFHCAHEAQKTEREAFSIHMRKAEKVSSEITI
jgi:hypothetical protein